MRPLCNHCGARLTGEMRGGQTMCPKCGRVWTLSPDHQHIQITLQVQDVTHRASSRVGT